MSNEDVHDDIRAHALVVDDQASTTMLAHAILGRAGYRVDECASGHAAIAAMSARRYDLVVLDLNLPDISGLDLLRRWELARLPPVLGMTSGLSSEVVERAEAVGMKHILKKPISEAQLVATAAAAIRDAKSMQIVACEGPPIDPLVLSEVRETHGETFFRCFVEQALTDVWHCMSFLESVGGDDLANWRKHAQALEGVAHSLGAHRLTKLIKEVLLLPPPRLRESTRRLTGQFSDLLGEVQETIDQYLRQHLGRVMEDPQRLNPPHGQHLSEREMEVLRWMAAGRTTSETAAILGISSRTVTFHITNTLLKLDAVNKTQAVVKAVMLNLI